jgi:hypothetical protein
MIAVPNQSPTKVKALMASARTHVKKMRSTKLSRTLFRLLIRFQLSSPRRPPPTATG